MDGMWAPLICLWVTIACVYNSLGKQTIKLAFWWISHNKVIHTITSQSSFWRMTLIFFNWVYSWVFPNGSAGKESVYNTRDTGRSPEGGHGNPLKFSCLENPMDRGAWCGTVHGVTKSWKKQRNNTQLMKNNGIRMLKGFCFWFSFFCLFVFKIQI